MAISITKYREFFANDIWHVRLEKFPKWQRLFIKTARIVLLSVRDFNEKKLFLRSSALTYFSMLSIVPVVAMIFGISKGFGLEGYIDEQLNKAFAGQPQIGENLKSYSHNLLQNTQGGWVAGLGFVLLLWTIIQVLSNIEDALNSVWHVKQPRTWARKFTDYLSIMVVAPIFIILSGAANIFISTQIQTLAETLTIFGDTVREIIIISIKFVPFLSTWILFFFVYIVLPNTRVKIRSAIIAGIIAGTCFQLFQWGYIEFQVGVSRLNAIYGSFASIPLFITWLYYSWTIVLVGAEISYSIQHVTTFEAQEKTKNLSYEMRMLYHLHIIHHIAKKFREGKAAPNIQELSHKLDIPAAVCRNVLDNAIKANLVVEALNPKTKDTLFTPAVDIAKLTMSYIIQKLNSVGEMKRGTITDESFQKIKTYYNELEVAMHQSPSNKHIIDL
jgi:membrane protein